MQKGCRTQQAHLSNTLRKKRCRGGQATQSSKQPPKVIEQKKGPHPKKESSRLCSICKEYEPHNARTCPKHADAEKTSKKPEKKQKAKPRASIKKVVEDEEEEEDEDTIEEEEDEEEEEDDNEEEEDDKEEEDERKRKRKMKWKRKRYMASKNHYHQSLGGAQGS